MQWTSNKPVVMILNGTNSISSDLKMITFSIYHLLPPQVIGKHKIYSFLLVFYPASLQYQISLGSGGFCVTSLTTVYYLCSERFCQPPEFLCYYKYTKNLFCSKILWIAAGLIVLYQLTVSRKPGVEMMTDSAFQCMLWWNEQAKRSMGDLY